MKKIVWVLLDNRMGSVGIARGILQELGDGFEIIEKNIVYNRFSGLPNFLRGKSLLGLDQKQSSPLKNEVLPDVVISISRRTTPIALWIKKQSKDSIKIVQLLYSGKFGLKDIDLVITPEHDRGKSKSKNIFYMTGSPHRISEKTMQEARQKWEPIFAHLPKPHIAVIIGGAIKGKPFPLEVASDFADEVLKIHNQTSGSILITSSKRTGDEPQKLIMDKLGHIPAYTYLWGEKKENPLMGFYACADKIIVTGDSVSMASESCGTGAPTLIFTNKSWLTKKHLLFAKDLCAKKYATNISSPDAVNFKQAQKLLPSKVAAQKIRELVGL